jgi:Sec-independent protein translocase protein TatA
MGLGAGILLVLLLGLLVLGPRQLHTMLVQVARAKAQLENAKRGFKSQLAAELGTAPEDSESNRWHLTSDRTTLCRIEQHTQ